MRLLYYSIISTYCITFVVSLLNIKVSRMLIRNSIRNQTFNNKGKIRLLLNNSKLTAKLPVQMNSENYFSSAISSSLQQHRNEKFPLLDSINWSNKVIVIAGIWFIYYILFLQ